MADVSCSNVERSRRRHRRPSLWSDLVWALDGAARSPQAQRAAHRAGYSFGAALAVLAALIVHAALTH